MSRENPLTTHDNAGIAAWSFKLKAEIDSYESAREFVQEHDPDHAQAVLGPHMMVRLLGDGRPEVYGPFQEETHNHGDIYAVVLYDTEIIRYYPDGTFSADNGGFATPTTMYRLNAVLPGRWRANHYKKQLQLTRPGHDGSQRIFEVYPATHDTRVKA